MKTITIKLDEREVAVSKIPLGKYSELLKGLTELPKHFEKFINTEDSKFFETLPGVIAACIDDFSKIVAIGSNLEAKEVEETLGIDEVVKVVVAIIEVNDYSEAWANVKKIVAQGFGTTNQPTAPTTILESGSGTPSTS